MQYIRSLVLFLFLFVSFSSCQKELNFASDNTSVGTLKTTDGSEDCLQSSVSGVYNPNTELGSDNFIYVLVDVTTTGTYNIYSDTINGYSFSGSGAFGNKGPNLVKLNAKGTPIEEGVNTFKVSYGETFCMIDVTVGSTSTDAVYTFGLNGTNCDGATIGGTNQQGVSMGLENTVIFNISVTTPGSYNITTEEVNGVVYKANGTFTGTETTVKLIGEGIPTLEGPFNFTATGGGNSCTFSVTFDPPPGPADFTLECTNSRQGGIYTVGVATDATNTDTISVNVTTPGSYQISTDEVNGVKFTASGVFTITGIQDVVLYASGTPADNGSYTYNISGSSCSFDVTTDYIICSIDGVPSTFNFNASWGVGALNGLSIDGVTNSGSINPSINLRVLVESRTYTPGVYTTLPPMDQITVSCDYNDESDNYYAGTGLSYPFTIKIDKITDRRLEGEFFGTLRNNGGNGTVQKEITGGKFSVPRQ